MGTDLVSRQEATVSPKTVSGSNSNLEEIRIDFFFTFFFGVRAELGAALKGNKETYRFVDGCMEKHE